jgi:hypothetical protein
MNVGNGTVAAQFLFWEYLFRIFGVVFCSVFFGFLSVGKVLEPVQLTESGQKNVF